MLKHPQLTEKRFRETFTRIGQVLLRSLDHLEVSAWHAPGEPVSCEEAMARKFEPFGVGSKWGGVWGTTWFKFTGKVPEAKAHERIHARVRLAEADGSWFREGFTTEGLVWVDGKPLQALNTNRDDIPLTKQTGEEFVFYVEAAANIRAEEGAVNGSALLNNPDYAGKPMFFLSTADIVAVDLEAEALQRDFRVAMELLFALPVATREAPLAASCPRRGELFHALNAACNVFHENDRSTFAKARAELSKALSRKNGDTVHRISAVGHAHIDTAWLWPLRETMRKCARTFSTQLAYMDEYPDFVFVCSQAQQYAWMKERYPTIYEKIREKVRAGQWEPVGSMWIEADCNLSGGESLVRQIVQGKRYFMDEFGYETTDVWIPDVFGYSASMPQIMKAAGVKYFLTQKISWSQFNKFPHHTFWWEGIDGTRIFSHFLPADTYNAVMNVEEIRFSEQNHRDHGRSDRSLYVYGFGDGGGGPTRGMIEQARRCENLQGVPPVKMERVRDFFEKAEAEAKDLATWVGELYLELHRGTYTTQGANKKGNRVSEFLLRDAEFFDALAGSYLPAKIDAPHAVYDVTDDSAGTNAALLDRAWKLLLLNQFHDIIPGSSIHWVYEDSARDYATIARLTGAVVDGGLAQWVQQVDTKEMESPVLAVNSLGQHRSEVALLPDGKHHFVEVPSCGYSVVETASDRRVESFAMPVEVQDRKRIIALDNGMVRVVFDKQDGSLRNVRDHRLQREVLASGQTGNQFHLLDDHPTCWDAWDVDVFAQETCKEVGDLVSMRVVEQSPLYAAVEIVKTFGRSKVRQIISLRAASPRLDFDTEIDWQEDHKFLKVAFPVNVRSSRATYEIQYGNVERPTNFNTSWDVARFEVCAQKWVDLSEAGYGVALLNDGKYGHDIHDNVMRISLLRSSTAPDPIADRGVHRFRYALLPHVGSFREGRVVEEAYAFNSPLRFAPVPVQEGSLPRSQSWFEVDRPGVVIEAVKRADRENAIIVRLYEAHGGRGNVVLQTRLDFTEVHRTDLLERTTESIGSEDGAVSLHLKPFEIVTLKFVLK